MDFFLLICICCAVSLVPSHALLVYVVDEVGQTFPVELSPEATVRELAEEIVRMKSVNTNEYNIVISFQGEDLKNWDVALADTSISNECTLSARLVDAAIIELPLVTGSSESGLHDNSMALQWDTRKDITQFTWPNNTIQVEILFCVSPTGTGRAVKTVAYKWEKTRHTLSSHLMFLVPNNGSNVVDGEEFTALPKVQQVAPHNLAFESSYWRDILVVPPRDHTMALQLVWWRRGLGNFHARYQIPSGYALLLRYDADP